MAPLKGFFVLNQFFFLFQYPVYIFILSGIYFYFDIMTIIYYDFFFFCRTIQKITKKKLIDRWRYIS